MRPALYLRPGVTLKHLTPDTCQGFDTAAGIFFKYQQPFAVTCTSTRNPMTGPLCPDQQVFGVEIPESAAVLILKECHLELGEDWCITAKKTYWKFEHNPKPLEGTPL